jgi:hypothetical protein
MGMRTGLSLEVEEVKRENELVNISFKFWRLPCSVGQEKGGTKEHVHSSEYNLEISV